jgi:hypothetical protein
MPRITFDTETGNIVGSWPESGITGQIGATIAAQLLPGMTADDVADAYDQWSSRDLDPTPFAKGARVKQGSDGEALGAGTVLDRRETEGELHSVLVRWPETPESPEWRHPRELVEVRR